MDLDVSRELVEPAETKIVLAVMDGLGIGSELGPQYVAARGNFRTADARRLRKFGT